METLAERLERGNKKLREKIRREARIEARKEALSEGRAKGRAEGRTDATVDIAQKMLKENAQIEFILKVTELSKEELEKIKSNLNKK